MIWAVGDTTYLDYKAIREKTEGYGPSANGGQGLILHTNIAVEPEKGLPLGILWQKLWHRPPDTLEQDSETKISRKQKQAAKRQINSDSFKKKNPIDGLKEWRR